MLNGGLVLIWELDMNLEPTLLYKHFDEPTTFLHDKTIAPNKT